MPVGWPRHVATALKGPLLGHSKVPMPPEQPKEARSGRLPRLVDHPDGGCGRWWRSPGRRLPQNGEASSTTESTAPVGFLVQAAIEVLERCEQRRMKSKTHQTLHSPVLTESDPDRPTNRPLALWTLKIEKSVSKISHAYGLYLYNYKLTSYDI